MPDSDLERFRLKLREYRLLVNRSQGDLAAYLNLDYNELSSRLNAHKNARLSHENVRTIVRALADWGAITTQAQAVELLDLMLCPHFEMVDLQALPLSKLVTSDNHAAAKPALIENELTAKLPPHNLPQQPSSFIGRKDELFTLRQLIKTTRLLTITGTGGAGKTRLALKLGEDLLAYFPQGIWLVELAALTDPKLVPQTVATTLGIRVQASKPLLVTIAETLQSKKIMLILDNCEHLIEACARLADHLLRNCSGVCLLVTSREALAIDGETTWRIPSLSLPEPEDVLTFEDLSKSEAVQFFTERATNRLPDFKLTSQNGSSVLQLCRRLDGIPLAIELAAARIHTLTPQQLTELLDDRFRLLTNGSRLALPRQKTLRGTIDWSYDLLSQIEQVVLQRLSVFTGDWTLEAAEKVCVGTGGLVEDFEVLDCLDRLVSKSMLIVVVAQVTSERGNRGQNRYRMLETIRQYAYEKLLASGDELAVRGLHFNYYNNFIQTSLEKKSLPYSFLLEKVSQLDLIDFEYENIRAALEWSLGSASCEINESGFELVLILWGYWIMRGHLGEGRLWLELALKLSLTSASPATSARLLMKVGNLCTISGDFQQAAAYCSRALDLSNQCEDKITAALSLYGWGQSALGLGNFEEARRYFAQSISLHEESADAFGLALARYGLAFVTRQLGDFKLARQLLQASLADYREIESKWGLAWALLELGRLNRAEKDLIGAREVLQESFNLFDEFADNWGRAIVYLQLGKVTMDLGLYEEADKFFQLCLNLSKQLGQKDWTIRVVMDLANLALLRFDYPQAKSLLEESLALLSFTDNSKDISRIQLKLQSITANIPLVLKPDTVHLENQPIKRRAVKNTFGLTRRELELLQLIARGLSNSQVAEILTISGRTVDSHLTSIYRKLGVTSRSAAAHYASQNGLLS